MKVLLSHEHPDANLLAGFTERTLRQDEHLSVLAHLAGCASCRECLACLTESKNPPRNLHPLPWRFAVLAAALACAAIVSWRLIPHRRTPIQPAPPPVLALTSPPLPLRMLSLPLRLHAHPRVRNTREFPQTRLANLQPFRSYEPGPLYKAVSFRAVAAITPPSRWSWNIASAAPRDQIVVRTTVGEKWISLDSSAYAALRQTR